MRLLGQLKAHPGNPTRSPFRIAKGFTSGLKNFGPYSLMLRCERAEDFRKFLIIVSLLHSP
jgi:hypothetical protein